LIRRLRETHGLAYLLICHNLAVVEELCEQTAVMYLGLVVELGATPRSSLARHIRTPLPSARRFPRSIPQREVVPGRIVACHRAEEVLDGRSRPG
jgi:ABC-type glutathione transport system ATPase component